MSSLSKATVFRVNGLTKHYNADTLMVGEFEGCPFIVNMNDTKDGDLRIFVPFDVCCPNEDWVGNFIRGQRVKPMRLRGVFSMAVCLPLPEGCEATEGDDVTELLGFTKWERPEEIDNGLETNSRNGYSCGGPSGLILPKYDLESLRKYHSQFVEGEEVVCTAKLDGENISVVYWKDELYVRSRTRWIKEGDNKWWEAVKLYNWDFLKDYPGYVVCGEKYGNLAKFRYDCENGEQLIRAFDVYDANTQRFLSFTEFEEFFANCYIPTVPVLYRGRWLGLDAHKDLADGSAVLGGDIEEGFVCEPIEQRFVRGVGRFKVKYHSEKYLLFKAKLK